LFIYPALLTRTAAVFFSRMTEAAQGWASQMGQKKFALAPISAQAKNEKKNASKV